MRLPFRLLISSLAFLATSQVLSAQPTLSGRVTGLASGIPVVGADLDVFDQTGAAVVITGGKTGADGTYTITLPGPGSYRLRVDMKVGDPLADQYYGGGIQKSMATALSVASSSVVTGIDIALPAGHSVSGRVIGGGAGIGGIDLDVYSLDREFLSSYPGTTMVDGFFELGPLPTGSYYIRADPDPALGHLWVDTYHGDSLDIVGATPIVISNLSVLGKDINLSPGGLIAGTIRSASNVLLFDIDLDVFYSTGARAPFSARSGPDGSYVLGALPAGSYYLRADPLVLSGHARTLYPSGVLLANASLVEVTVSQTTAGIDFSLMDSGTISGTIRDAQTLAPLAGVDLDVFDTAGNRLSFSAKTAADGSYRLGPFPPGGYIIRSDPLGSSAYVGAYFDAVSLKVLGTSVKVVAGVETTSVDFDLTEGGWIAGVIRSSTGTPLANVDLDVFDQSGQRLEPSALSAVDGGYILGPLPAGRYLVRADPSTRSGHMSAFYPVASDLVGATAVAVGATATTSGVDFSLADAGWIEGVIRDETGSPLDGIDLDIFDATTLTRLRTGGTSRADGRYELGPLPVGSYILRADPTPPQHRVREYYSEKAVRATATPVSVSAGVGALNIDFTLDPGASISGFVTSLENGTSISGADIDIYRASDMFRMDQSAKTLPDGSFVVGPLPGDTYILRIDALSASTYVDAYFGDTADPALAASIVISPPMDLASVDVSLPTISVQYAFSPEISLQIQGGVRSVNFRFPTQAGVTYQLQRSDSPAAVASWTTIAEVRGDGLEALIGDPLVTSSAQRFYRFTFLQ